jgi:hypothetical protein
MVVVDGSGRWSDYRRQKAEGRGQRAEGRGQRAEGRGQRAEGRGQSTPAPNSGQDPEVWSRKPFEKPLR